MGTPSSSLQELSIIVAIETFLAFRKAIMSMKDVSAFITLRARKRDVFEISAMDSFRSTGLYTFLPCLHEETEDIFCPRFACVASEELVKLASALKAYPDPIRITFHANTSHSVFVANANNGRALLHQRCPFPLVLDPCFVNPIATTDYYWVKVISQDFLNILVNLSVGSAVMELSLDNRGKLVFSNKHEYGCTIIEKQLDAKTCAQNWDYNNNKDQKQSGVTEKPPVILSQMRYVIKFIKQVVNLLVNCSQNTSLLGIPKQQETHPLVLRFLLSRDKIYEYFLMMPFKEPLEHTWRTKSTQNPLCFVSRDSVAA